MIIESEDQYQGAVERIRLIFEANSGKPPEAGTPAANELEDLVAEIKIYENRYHNSEAEEIPTFEFWTAKKGVINPEGGNPDHYEIVKLKENELTQQHIELLVGTFINDFEKLPAKAKRIVRQKLRY